MRIGWRYEFSIISRFWRNLIPLKRNLYIEEVCDLEPSSSRRCDDAIPTGRQANFRFHRFQPHSHDELMRNDRSTRGWQNVAGRDRDPVA